MGLFGNDDLSKMMKNQEKAHNKINKRNTKAVNKMMSASSIKSLISKEGRIRIPAKRRHEVEDKYKKKCAVCKRSPPPTLQIHHINQKNSDNRLSNLKLLCPNHHYTLHSKGKNKKR
tara:strand:+ start:677 stop:1027 length:351 start_codon:yes stop_codon:yes gene_type:complete